MCTAAIGVGAVAEYVAQTPSLRHAPELPQSPPTAIAPSPHRTSQTENAPAAQSVLVYVPSMDASGIVFSRQESPVADGEDPKLVAINAFLRASQIAPDGAEATDVQVQEGGSAVVTFNKAFDQTYGTFDEKKLIDGLRAALGQFGDVQEFAMVIDGKPITTLGSADLASPIQVLRPEEVPLTKAAPTEPEAPVKP